MLPVRRYVRSSPSTTRAPRSAAASTAACIAAVSSEKPSPAAPNSSGSTAPLVGSAGGTASTATGRGPSVPAGAVGGGLEGEERPAVLPVQPATRLRAAKHAIAL